MMLDFSTRQEIYIEMTQMMEDKEESISITGKKEKSSSNSHHSTNPLSSSSKKDSLFHTDLLLERSFHLFDKISRQLLCLWRSRVFENEYRK